MAKLVLPADYAPHLLSPAWRDVQGTGAGQHLTIELQREVASAHVLAGAELTAVAARGFTADPNLDLPSEVIGLASGYTSQRPKEVIYYVSSLNHWAVVHLTWATKPESHSECPSTVLAHDWAAVIEELHDRNRP